MLGVVAAGTDLLVRRLLQTTERTPTRIMVSRETRSVTHWRLIFLGQPSWLRQGALTAGGQARKDGMLIRRSGVGNHGCHSSCMFAYSQAHTLPGGLGARVPLPADAEICRRERTGHPTVQQRNPEMPENGRSPYADGCRAAISEPRHASRSTGDRRRTVRSWEQSREVLGNPFLPPPWLFLHG